MSIEKKPKKKKNYLNNRDLFASVNACLETGIMSDHLARMLQALCLKHSKKSNFSGYTYIEDMRSYAMLMLVRTWKAFNPEKSNNPLAFFSRCIHRSFIQFLNQERKHRDIRDAQLVSNGLLPSYSYQEKNNGPMITDESSDEATLNTSDYVEL